MNYNQDLERKHQFLNKCFTLYPEIEGKIDHVRKLHNCTLKELKYVATIHIEHVKMERAAKRLQKFWRQTAFKIEAAK